MDESTPLAVRLRDEQLRLLARNVPSLVFGTLMLGLGATAMLWVNGQSVGHILAWMSALTALSGWRWWMARRFWRDVQAGGSPRSWLPVFMLASALAGLCWGSLAWPFFTPDNPVNLAVVAILITAILSSASQSLGPFFPAHLVFALPCILPFIVRCLASGETMLLMLGLLSLLFLAMTELFSLRIARAIEDALRLRFENESLVAQLTTEKERAESASRAKTRFLATASHDLRQPIHAMSLFVPALKTLSARAEINPRTVGGIAARMQGALDTMAQLLNRLLDISRLDAGATQPRPQAVALRPVLQRVLDEVTAQARAKGLRLRLRERGLAVHTDPAVLHTILSNLASNAVRYTERGGVLLASRRRGGCVRIEVWDTGVGIEARDLPLVTEEFFQADNARRDASQARGFGLGLSIVKRSTELIGSRLICHSRPGRGSVFGVALPAAAVEPPEVPAAPPPLRASRAVLVVDDDPQILVAMGLLLRGWGHEALMARHLEGALAAVAAAPRPPEIALVDMHLSADAHGLQVVAALRERLGAGLRVALVTGDTSAQVLTQIRAAGVVALHKPVAPEALRRYIDGTPPAA